MQVTFWGRPASRHTLRLPAGLIDLAEPFAGATVASASGKVSGAWGDPVREDLPGSEGRLLPQVRPVACVALPCLRWRHRCGSWVKCWLATTACGYSDKHQHVKYSARTWLGMKAYPSVHSGHLPFLLKATSLVSRPDCKDWGNQLSALMGQGTQAVQPVPCCTASGPGMAYQPC